jgi:hypothetical protein
MMRIKLRHCSLFAGSLLLAACGDDSSATPDTDASSSSDATTSGGPTDPTVDPDSSSSGNPTTSPETTVDSSGSESSSSDDGGACIIPTTILADPSFEGGANASEWGEASSAFGTPLCDSGCGGPDAQDGSWYVWVGGSPGGDIGGVSQEVTIGKADSLELSFYFQYGVEGTGSDLFQLQIDGDVLWEVTNADIADYAAWTLVTIDVSAYADGGNHDIDFTGSASGNANLFLDNIQLETCGTGAAITESDSVDPAMTGGGETDTTTDTGGMLTCEDIGNTVPVAQDGNNDGSGNDIVPSCLTGNGDGAGEDVGYTWTAPADGTYRFDTLGSPLDTVLVLLDTCDSGGTELACNDDSAGTFQSLVTLPMTAGQTIAIVVDGWDAASVDDFTLNIDLVSCDPPIDLGNNEPIDQDGDNTGAGDDVSASCGGTGGEDVVYTWQAPDAGIYSISASSLVLAPVVSAYSGTCGDPGAEIGCAADNNLAAFNVVVAQDQQISIVVDGATAEDVGTYALAITQTGVLSGDCCAADDSAGCEDATISQCTCGVDISGFAGPTPIDPADCCTGDWTAECAAVADAACDAGCDAGVDGGACCVGDSGVGGCDVPEVQDCVCAFDSYCCDTEWDAECVAKGQLFCSAQCA